MSDYTRIYLQPECCADEDTGRLWCQDDAPQSCPDGGQWTPYILKSEYDRLQAENEALRAALEDMVNQVERDTAMGLSTVTSGCVETALDALERQSVEGESHDANC